jgi:hypothetical protein
MPTLKPGQKQIQFVLDEDSEVHLTLLEWAKKRNLSGQSLTSDPGRLVGCYQWQAQFVCGGDRCCGWPTDADTGSLVITSAGTEPRRASTSGR